MCENIWGEGSGEDMGCSLHFQIVDFPMDLGEEIY